MNTIHDLALTRLNANELSKVGSKLISIIAPLQDDAYVARLCAEIANRLDVLRTIKSTPSRSELTETIKNIDSEIDRLLLNLEAMLKVNVDQHAFFLEKAESSEVLLKPFQLRNRDTLMHGGYTDQGEEIATLLKDIFAEGMEAHREASGTAPIWDALKRWYDKLQELLEQRLQEGNLPATSREERKKLTYRISSLLVYLDTNITDGIEGFEAILTPINELITEVMSAMRSRMTRKENKEQHSFEDAVLDEDVSEDETVEN